MNKWGWIKLDRKILNCWVWEERPFSIGQAWVDLILKANHSEKKLFKDGNLTTVERGQLMTSVRKLAERWGWQNKKVLNFLKLLESDGMVTRTATQRGTLLTLVNYDKFQLEGNMEGYTDGYTENHSIDHTVANTLDHTHAPLTRKKECKEGKNVKNNNRRVGDFYPDPELNKAMVEFIEMRKRIKKPMTENAIKMLMNRLDKLAPHDNNLKIEMLRTSEFNNWLNVYPPKGVANKEPAQNNKDAVNDLLNQLINGE